MTIDLTQANYFSNEANRDYWSVSQFKTFDRCEAMGLAELNGQYHREETTALLVGSYVDAHFSGEHKRFVETHPEIFNSRSGELKADYRNAGNIIRRIESDPLMMEYLKGDKQTIMTANVFGVPWKCKIDAYDGKRITDLKIVKDFKPIFDDSYGWRSWVEYWCYDIQGAMYQRIEQMATGRTEPLPFYIVAATKERVPDIAVIQIPQHVLDAAFELVRAKIDRFDLIKAGDVEPIRCEVCDYCKSTKRLKAPEIYEIPEA